MTETKPKDKRMKVYVAGPITIGHPAVNVREGVLAGERIYQAGGLPYVPHLTHLWDLIVSHSWEDWMDMDLPWVEACDAIVRLPGESKGADREVAHAQECGILVFSGVGPCLAWLKDRAGE